MSRRDKRDDDLDTETTFANMNVDGFRWYDPSKNRKEKTVRQKVSRREYWSMVRGAFAAVLPYFCIFLLSVAAVGVLIYFWLK